MVNTTELRDIAKSIVDLETWEGREVDAAAGELEILRDFIEHVSVTVHAPEENYTEKQRIDDLERAFGEYGINTLMRKWSVLKGGNDSG